MYDQSQLKGLVDQSIVDLNCNKEAVNLIDPVRYVLSIGGKRIRPVLALMACNLFSENIDEAVMPSVGLEVFHNFTLVHDDIMDQAPLRRSFPTVHSKWNINQAVLSGDVMAFIANDCFLKTPDRYLSKVFRVFNKAAVEVCVGQQLDIDFEKANHVSQDQYIRMIELKTAVLMAASVKIGGIIGGADEKDADMLYEFGRNLGLAFQLQDDLLDIYGNVNVFGKIAGGDIISNKKTFLLIKALEIASREQHKKLKEQFSAREFEPDIKVKKVVEIYDQLNIKDITENLANDYFEASFGLLEKINVGKERKKELALMASSLIGRDK